MYTASCPVCESKDIEVFASNIKCIDLDTKKSIFSDIIKCGSCWKLFADRAGRLISKEFQLVIKEQI